MSDKSEDILCVLRRNKSITKQTIDSLIKNGFNSNETLSALDLDLDLPQMTDICCQQKRCLRQVFEKHNFGFNCYSILYKYREIEDNQQSSEESDEEINTSDEKQLKSNESKISSNIEMKEKSEEKEKEERISRHKIIRDLYSGNNHRFEIFLQKSLTYDLTDYEDSEESLSEDSEFETKKNRNKSPKSETFEVKPEFDSQFNYDFEKFLEQTLICGSSPQKTNSMTLSNHLDISNEKKDILLSCKGLASKKKVQQFYESGVIDGKRVYFCRWKQNETVCQFKTLFGYKIARHINLLHIGVQFKCPKQFCNKVFKDPNTYREHQKNHICGFGLFGYGSEGVLGVCRNENLNQYRDRRTINSVKVHRCLYVVNGSQCGWFTKYHMAMKRSVPLSESSP